MKDDFFIGYRPELPADLARFAALVSGGLICLAIGLAVALTYSQNEPSEATFEYGVSRQYSGIVRADPYPRLEMSDGSTVLLVAPFKHGADEAVFGTLGSRITLDGSLIRRGRLAMVEIDPASIAPASASAPDAGPTRVAPLPPASASDIPSPITIRGEILDGKCYLGVMKPGEGTVHRACARLCLRGGVPALIVFIDGDGHSRTALLTTGGEERLPEGFLRYVGRPVEATGSYDPEAAGGIGVFTVDTRTVRIL